MTSNFHIISQNLQTYSSTAREYELSENWIDCNLAKRLNLKRCRVIELSEIVEWSTRFGNCRYTVTVPCLLWRRHEAPSSPRARPVGEGAGRGATESDQERARVGPTWPESGPKGPKAARGPRVVFPHCGMVTEKTSSGVGRLMQAMGHSSQLVAAGRYLTTTHHAAGAARLLEIVRKLQTPEVFVTTSRDRSATSSGAKLFAAK